MRASTLVIAFSALVAAQSGAPSESNAMTLPTASQSTGAVPTASSTDGAGGSTGVGSSTTAAPSKSTSSGSASKTEGDTKTSDNASKSGASGSPTNSDNGAPMATAGPLSGLLAGAAVALFL